MALIRIRATTFNVQHPSGPRLSSAMWAREIRRAINTANEIYGPHYIAFSLSSVTHLSRAASEWLLTEDIREDVRRGIATLDTLMRWENRAGEDRRRHLAHRGARRNRGLRLGGHFLLSEQRGGGSRRPAGNEALNILRLNRASSEICTYWVPAMIGFYSGQAMMSHPFMSNITTTNEGIFMAYGARRCILAHEIGHLLSHAGHCSFEGESGEVEGSAPMNNLMHSDIINQGGTELNNAQINRMLSHGARYVD